MSDDNNDNNEEPLPSEAQNAVANQVAELTARLAAAEQTILDSEAESAARLLTSESRLTELARQNRALQAQQQNQVQREIESRRALRRGQGLDKEQSSEPLLFPAVPLVGQETPAPRASQGDLPPARETFDVQPAIQGMISPIIPDRQDDTFEAQQLRWQGDLGLTGMALLNSTSTPALFTNPPNERPLDEPPDAGSNASAHPTGSRSDQPAQASQGRMNDDAPPGLRGERHRATEEEERREIFKQMEHDLRDQIMEELEKEYAFKLEEFKLLWARLHPPHGGDAMVERDMRRKAILDAMTSEAEKEFTRGGHFQEDKERRLLADQGDANYAIGSVPLENPRRGTIITADARKAVGDTTGFSQGQVSVVTAGSKMKHPLLTYPASWNLISVRDMLSRCVLFSGQAGSLPPKPVTFCDEVFATKLVEGYNSFMASPARRAELGLAPIAHPMTMEVAQYLTGFEAEEFFRLAMSPKTPKEAEEMLIRGGKALEVKFGLVSYKGKVKAKDIRLHQQVTGEICLLVKYTTDWWPQYSVVSVGGRRVQCANNPGVKPSPAKGTLGLIGAATAGAGWGPRHPPPQSDPTATPPQTHRQILESQLAATSQGETRQQMESVSFQAGRMFQCNKNYLHARDTCGLRDATFDENYYGSGSRASSAEREDRKGSYSEEDSRGRELVARRDERRAPRERSGSRGGGRYLQRLQADQKHARRELVAINARVREERDAFTYDAGQVPPALDDSDDDEEPDRHRKLEEPLPVYDRRLLSNQDMERDSRYYDYDDSRRSSRGRFPTDEDYDHAMRRLAVVAAHQVQHERSQRRDGDRGRLPDNGRQDQRERPRQDSRDVREFSRTGDTRYPSNPGGRLSDTRGRSPADRARPPAWSLEKSAYMAGQPCYGEMKGHCPYEPGKCPYSHDSKVIAAAFDAIKNHQNYQQPPRPSGQLVPMPARAPALQQVVPRGQPVEHEAPQYSRLQPQAGVSWGADYDTQRAHLDVHYHRELAALARNAPVETPHVYNRELMSEQRRISQAIRESEAERQDLVVLGYNDGELAEYGDSSGYSSDA